jgi:hypothetical protein
LSTVVIALRTHMSQFKVSNYSVLNIKFFPQANLNSSERTLKTLQGTQTAGRTMLNIILTLYLQSHYHTYYFTQHLLGPML